MTTILINHNTNTNSNNTHSMKIPSSSTNNNELLSTNAQPQTIDPLELLKYEINSSDYAQSVHAPLKIVSVSLSIGPERTRNELLPYLYDTVIHIENDELLTNLAIVLQFVCELIGGSTYIKDSTVMLIYESLLCEEEYIVRQQASISLNILLVQLNKIDIINIFIPMLKKLCQGEWFTTRVSAANLFHAVYPLVNDNIQAELRVLYAQLCNDDTPMVRKKCYENLAVYGKSLQTQYLCTDIYNVLDQIVNDDLDSIRSYAIDNIAQLTTYISHDDITVYILPILDKLIADQSWRIRMHLANTFPKITDYLLVTPNQLHSLHYIKLYSVLVKDLEPEVRNAATKCLAKSANNIKYGVSEYITNNILLALSNDSIQQIRVSFSEIIIELCPLYERDNTQKILLPIIQNLTRDESYEVRYNTLRNIDSLCTTIGSAGIVSQILPYYIELSKDQKWRVRYSIICNCNYLTKLLGEKIFHKRIQPILISALNDHVFAIREIACIQIGLIIEQLGDEWASEKLFNNVFTIFDTQINYLHRITCLMIIQQSIQYCSVVICDQYLFPILYQASIDDVPNVKLSAAKTLISFIQKYDSQLIRDKIQPLVDALKDDSDCDVRYFANKTDSIIQQKLAGHEITHLISSYNNNANTMKDNNGIHTLLQQTQALTL